MKRSAITCAILLAAFAVGCSQRETQQPIQANPQSQAAAEQNKKQLDKIASQTKQVAEDVKDYAYAQRKEFSESLRAQADAIEDDLDDLGDRIEKAGDQAKAEAKPQIDAIRASLKDMRHRLDTLADSDEPKWDTVKRDTRKAMDELKESVRKARQWAADKIAPA